MSTTIQFCLFTVAILFCFAGTTSLKPLKPALIRWSYSSGKKMDKKLCMTPCAKHGKSYSWCYVSWTKWDYCDLQSEDDPNQIFVTAEKSFKEGQVCTSLCGKFDWDSEWCYVGTPPNDWERCSTKQIMVSFTTIDSELCMTDCLLTKTKSEEKIFGTQQYLCKTDWSTFKECNPQSLFINTAVTSKNMRCSSLCGNFGTSYPWCEADGTWHYCSDSSFLSLNKAFDSKELEINNLSPSTRDKMLSEFSLPLSAIKRTRRSFSGFLNAVCPLAGRIVGQNIAQNYINTIGRLGALTGFVFRDGIEFMRFQYTMVNDVMLVHTVQATLYPRFMPASGTRRNANTVAINRHMTDHGARYTDVRGHILAHQLGGPTHITNIVPQSQGHNFALLNGRISRWAQLENEIADHLEQMRNTGGFILWNMAIYYDPVTYRPLKYVIQYSIHRANQQPEIMPDEEIYDF